MRNPGLALDKAPPAGKVGRQVGGQCGHETEITSEPSGGLSTQSGLMGGRGVGVTSLFCSSLLEEKTNKGDARLLVCMCANEH